MIIFHISNGRYPNLFTQFFKIYNIVNSYFLFIQTKLCGTVIKSICFTIKSLGQNLVSLIGIDKLLQMFHDHIS